MTTMVDNSYLITGKVCPPQLPMKNINSDGWNSLTPALSDLLFTEVSAQGRQANNLNPLSALSFQASVWLSTDGLSASSVVGLPYFFCNFCDYHTDSKAQLLRHMACKHVFQCKICDFITVTRYELVQHQLHKHLDAEEMQPILSSKMIHLNLSLLQRSLKNLSQCDSNSNNLISSDSSFGKSELVNSSEMGVSKVLQDGQHDVLSDKLNAQSKCHPLVTKDKSAVINKHRSDAIAIDKSVLTAKDKSAITSSKCRVPITAVNVPMESDSLSETDWPISADPGETGRLSKRCHSQVEITNCGLSPKRFRKGCDDHQAKCGDVFVSCQSHSCQMPHFLDESDSNVTSSCSPYKSTPPVLLESIKTEQTSPKTHMSQAHDTNHAGRVLSFLMEPISCSASVKKTQSGTPCDDSPSALRTMQKILQWYNDKGDDNTSKDISPSSANVGQGYSMDHSSALFKTSRHVDIHECERGYHPKTSTERLQRQLENSTSKASSDLCLESCKELLESVQRGCHLLRSRDPTPARSLEASVRSTYLTSPENALAGTSCGRMRSELWCENSQSVENFLVASGHMSDTTAVKKIDNNIQRTQSEKDCTNDPKGNSMGHIETHSGADEGLKYDLLRKLLIGTAGMKEHTPTTTITANTEIDEKQPETSVSKDVLLNYPQASTEKCELRSHAPLLSRASDMSLKDLLTQSLESVPASVFFACGYCNLKSSSKAELQRHVEKCKAKQGPEKTKSRNNAHRLSCQAMPKPDYLNDEVNAVKAKIATSMEGLYSSEKFMASEVLKSLSEHYSETLSSDFSFQDKPDTSEKDFQINDTYSLCGRQAQCLDKTCYPSQEVEEVHDKHLRQRPARKAKPDVDYNYEPSSSSSSSDSDYQPHSVSSVRKKNRRRQNSKQETTISKRQGSTMSTSPFHSQDFLQQKQPAIHHACLYCDFSMPGSTAMRQHLIGTHLEQAPFAKALIHPKEKTMIYFCRGVHSGCTFISCEGVDIFEHIKLCYSGYLDNFIYDDDQMMPDYSHVFYALGEASKFIDQPAVMFYCLRCNYSMSDFQQVSSHASNNHANYVAGVLCVDKVTKQPRVGMVCLVCNAHILVNQWASHTCRKLARDEFIKGGIAGLSSDALSSPKLEPDLRLPSTPSSQAMNTADDNILDSCGLGSDPIENIQDFSDDCKPEMRFDHISDDCIQNHAPDSDTSSQTSNKYFSNNFSEEAVNIKQEVPDIGFTDEDLLDDVPVSFSIGHTEANAGGAGQFQIEENQNMSNRINPQDIITNSSHTYSRRISPGSSVLQSLLTAPRDAELAPNCFSLLQNLLKPDQAVKEKGQSRPSFVSPTETSSGPSSIHSQYPCILDMLSRQDCPGQETSLADSFSAPPKACRLQKDRRVDNATSLPSSALMTAFSSLQASSQQSQLSAVTKCLPNLSVSVTSKLSSVSVHELSPPLIPKPPQLPLLPPISPSPPSSPAVSLMAAGNQESPGPFANLLRLLSKTKCNAGTL